MLYSFMIDWTPQMTTDLFANVGGIIGDFTPLLTAVMGIGLALIVIGAIISAIRGHK